MTKFRLLTVSGRDYMVELASDGRGFYFTPCAFSGGYAIYDPQNVQQVIMPGYIGLFMDEAEIRRLIQIYSCLETPIELSQSN